MRIAIINTQALVQYVMIKMLQQGHTLNTLETLIVPQQLYLSTIRQIQSIQAALTARALLLIYPMSKPSRYKPKRGKLELSRIYTKLVPKLTDEFEHIELTNRRNLVSSIAAVTANICADTDDVLILTDSKYHPEYSGLPVLFYNLAHSSYQPLSCNEYESNNSAR